MSYIKLPSLGGAMPVSILGIGLNYFLSGMVLLFSFLALSTILLTLYRKYHPNKGDWA